MFTVLIAEKEHIDSIQQENKLFFEPFLKNKELAFCYWDPSGQNLGDSAPGLPEIVGRKKEWRAVIINSCTKDSLKMRNPFDVVDKSRLAGLSAPAPQPDSKESWDKWEADWKAYYDALTKAKESVYKSALEHPLQRLSAWLCFRPEDYILNDVQERQDVHDWAMEKIGRDDIKPSARLEHLERMQYKTELRMKEHIRRNFVSETYLNIAYPSEVYCISARTAENGFFDPDAFWNVRQVYDYSAFADRNLYFDKMRFMVFDLLPQTHRNFRTDYIRFLASVLVFASNPVPGGAMQARRVYRLETDADDTPLCTLVTSYDRKLASTYETIENEMERIRSEIPGELTDKAAEAMFCTPKDVAVLLDNSCAPEKVFAETDYGLFFDSPEDEYHKWNRDHSASKKEFAYIVRQRSRAVRKGVVQMHLHSEVSDANVSRLTPLQIEDIREYTDAAEDEMVASIPPDAAEASAYLQRMSQEAQNVRKVIGRRMTKKTTLILSALCLGLYFLSFLPFLLSNNGSIRTVSTAVVLSFGMLGILAVIMLVALFFLRRSVRDAVQSYNDAAQEIMGDIQASMKRFSNYLSAFCNVRRGHTVQNYARKHLDEYTKSLRIRKKHQEDIRKRRAILAEEYRDYFGDRSFCDETMSRPYDYDFEQKTEYDYPAPFLAGDCRQIEFISTGNYVTVPSSYITRIMVRMEDLYEK